MSTINLQLLTALERGVARMREARLPDELPTHMARLATQVDQPCVVAVVGRMKAGKSTFINAFLGQDLAKVGVTETTATINYFRHGRPDGDCPVRCHWQGGKVTAETLEFLNSLQGNDVASLKRAEAIEYLEYLLPNPYLEKVTLVDTPGTQASVDEHQNRTADFLALKDQLRDRAGRETERLGSEADAVIYLIGEIPRANDQAFLEAFQGATSGRSQATNSVGVMAKIDLMPQVLAEREHLATRIADQLRGALNTVVPVSAGIQRCLDRLVADEGRGLDTLVERLERIPTASLVMMLESDDLFLSEEFFRDCPVSLSERKEMLGDMPWGVFTAVARVAADGALSTEGIVERLREIAGFGPLKRVLERRFFERGQVLRCHRIVREARSLLDEIRYRQLPRLRDEDYREHQRFERYLAFVRGAPGPADVQRELDEYLSVTQTHSGHRAERAELAIRELDRDFGDILHAVEMDNLDIQALQTLDDSEKCFSQDELNELRPVFGLYGMDRPKRLAHGRDAEDYVEQRAGFWYADSQNARMSCRREVAEQAALRYGQILREMAQAKP
jgi:hypothetical protein